MLLAISRSGIRKIDACDTLFVSGVGFQAKAQHSTARLLSISLGTEHHGQSNGRSWFKLAELVRNHAVVIAAVILHAAVLKCKLPAKRKRLFTSDATVTKPWLVPEGVCAVTTSRFAARMISDIPMAAWIHSRRAQCIQSLDSCPRVVLLTHLVGVLETNIRPGLCFWLASARPRTREQ